MEILWNLNSSGDSALAQARIFWAYREILTVITEKQDLCECSTTHLYRGSNHTQVHSHQRRLVGCV